MRECFNDLNEVSIQEFIENFHLQETDPERREYPDGFSLDRIPEHKDSNHKYFKGILNEQGISLLVLPSHMHPNKTYIVESSGELFQEVIKKFIDILSKENSPCFKKANDQSKYFFNKLKPYQEAEFIYLCNNFNISHPKQYSEKWINKLFIGGGFHRLVAYGLFINRHGFSPLKVYYCEVD